MTVDQRPVARAESGRYQLFRLLLLAMLVLFVTAARNVGSAATLVAVSVLLIVYGAAETLVFVRKHKAGALANPAVLSSVFFTVRFAATNYVLFLVPSNYQEASTRMAATWLIKAAGIAFLSLAAVWFGFYADASLIQLGRALTDRMKSLIRWHTELRYMGLLLVYGTVIVVRIYAIQLGIYGYGGDVARVYELAGMTQYFDLLNRTGQIVLAVVAVAYFRQKQPTRLYAVSLVSILVLELAFGLLSGFKGQVLMPLLILFLCRAAVQKKLSLGLMIGSIVLALTTYSLVEGYRSRKITDASFSGRSITSITRTLVSVGQSDTDLTASGEEVSASRQLASRLNLLNDLAWAIWYGDTFSETGGDPEFLRNFLLAPIYAVVPRAVLPGKPYSDYGAWFTTIKFGANRTTSSTAMSAQGFLYLAAGIILVVVGSFVLGLLQSILWTIYRNSGAVGVVFLIAVALQISDPEYLPTDSVTAFVRMIPLALIVQAACYRR